MSSSNLSHADLAALLSKPFGCPVHRKDPSPKSKDLNKKCERESERENFIRNHPCDITKPRCPLRSLGDVCGHCAAWVWISTNCIMRTNSFYPLCFFLSTRAYPISPDHISRSQCNSLCTIVGVIIIVCVTGDRAGEVFLGGHEEGGD